MFELREDIQRQIDAVYEITEGLQRGDVLTHADIGSVLGLSPHEGSWGHIVGRVRRRLERERGIATWPETTVGYKLLTTDEQLKVLAWRARKANRQYRRAYRSVESLPEKDLTFHQRKARVLQLALIKEQQQRARLDLRTHKLLMTPRPAMPRRPAMET